MQFKPVPEPPDNLESVEPILAAVPVTAGAVDDCCHHLVSETRLETRSQAETWLVFLRALELVTVDSAGYRRATERPTSGALESESLQQPFRERVYGVETVLESLERAEEPLTAGDVSTEYREKRTGSDRRSSARRERLEDGATERVQRLLEWAVLLDLTDRTDSGRYRSTATPDGGAE